MLKAYQRDGFSVWNRVNSLRGDLEAENCCIYTDKGYSQSPIFQIQQKAGLACSACPSQPSLSHMADSVQPSLLWFLQPVHCIYKGIFPPGEEGKPKGLLGSFWKQKSSTSGSCWHRSSPPASSKTNPSPAARPSSPLARGEMPKAGEMEGVRGSGGHGWG